MSASKLKTLKVRVDHLVIGAVGVVVLVGGFVTWRASRPDPERDAIELGRESVRGKTRRPRGSSKPRFVRGYHQGSGAGAEEGEGLVVHLPPPTDDPGDLSASEAVTAFEQVIGELEAAVEDDRRLSQREEAELYNRATGSFTALSAWVDPNNPSERAMMNDAFSQMTALMRELDIERPAHDPDYNPMRR